MIIISSWTKIVSKSQVAASGLITFINVIIWFYVLQVVLEDLTNWRVMVYYALGCAIGTMLTTAFYQRKEAKENLAAKQETVVAEAT